ncbi:YpsA SLOG family protein [Desulfonatronum lacustre]|uniref:YpsA SLOG family protein n=1 Tax=Desulfonatronum lacustre TaxID=66849 RepID=UPI000684708E|nr:putative molybdenum carrier protein [Desulfonatronum lacustre]
MSQYPTPYRKPRTKIFERVALGGQTGADHGDLDAAHALGDECGGWCPKGRLSEVGPIPDKYPEKDWRTKGYPARTKANVPDSDGTLIFCHGKPTGGTGMGLILVHTLAAYPVKAEACHG